MLNYALKLVRIYINTLTKYNEYKPDIDDIDTDNSNDTKTIDDLRDTL